MSAFLEKGQPPLRPALAAMTGLQAVVALALFAPGVLAPSLGLSEAAIALFTTGCFAIGMMGALFGGGLVARFGSFAIAMMCMAMVAVAMGLSALASPLALAAAGMILGLAFGPETPASSALLGRLTTRQQAPLVFSLRQTGNQLGAILGSFALPSLALVHPQLGFAVIALMALIAIPLFARLRLRYDGLTRTSAMIVDPRAALSLVWRHRALRKLAIVSMPLAAMQLGLNAFLVTYLVNTLEQTHIFAGFFLGIAQAGGLFGRLGWGYVASRFTSPHHLIAMLAFAMAMCAASLACLPTHVALPLLVALTFTFGLTASGWNGVFLSEVARLAPLGQAGEATGAVLTASYGGLLIGPVLISFIAQISSLRLAYGCLALACVFAGLWMNRIRNA